MTRQSKAITGFSAIIISALWFFILWAPQQESLRERSKKINAANATKSSLQAEIDMLTRLKNDPKLEKDVARLEAAVPTTSDLDHFLRQLQSAASGAGVSISALAPSQPALPGPIGSQAPITEAATMQISISVSGSYEQTLAFMKELDSLDRLVVTDSANLQSNASKDGVIDTQFTVRMFTTQIPSTTVASRAETGIAK